MTVPHELFPLSAACARHVQAGAAHSRITTRKGNEMSIWTRLFGQKEKATNQSDETTTDSYMTGLHSSRKIPASYLGLTMPPGLDREGVSVTEFLQTSSNDQLRTALRQLPVENLIFDDFMCVLKKNGWAFELVLYLADELATYNWYLEKKPESGRRSDLPADELKDLLIPRLITLLRKHNAGTTDLTPSITRFLKEQLGPNLCAGGYPQDAKAIFEICQKQSYTHSEGEENLLKYWIYFCLYRIAFLSKNKDDIKSALDASTKFTCPPGTDPAILQKMLDWLTENQ